MTEIQLHFFDNHFILHRCNIQLSRKEFTNINCSEYSAFTSRRELKTKQTNRRERGNGTSKHGHDTHAVNKTVF